MVLEETIGIDARDYPSELLIAFSVIAGLLAVGHIVRFMQTLKLPHILFALYLICLSVHHILAIQNINVAYLTAIANSFTNTVTTMLFVIWTHSMRRNLSRFKINFIRFVVYGWQIIFILSAILTLIAVIYNASTSELYDTIQTAWQIILIVSIAGSANLFCFAFVLLFWIRPEEYGGELQKRLQILILYVLFLLLTIVNIFVLLEELLLYVAPYWLFHIILVLSRDLIVGYYHEPDNSIV
jgi:hypothetical protein